MQQAITTFQSLIKSKLYCLAFTVGLMGSSVILPSCSTEMIAGYPLLGASQGIGSATLLVNDLKSTRDFYADTLGFDIDKPEKFKKGVPTGTNNTTINFPDMSSLKLMTIEDSLVTSETPSFLTSFLAKHEGITRYALATSSVDTTYSFLTDQNFRMDSVKSYRTSDESAKGWTRDDGGVQEHLLAFQAQQTKPYLPTFIENAGSDYQRMQKMWNTFYAYYRSYSSHRNGVIGIGAIRIAVDSLESARAQFKQMGLKELKSRSSDMMAIFQLKRQQELQIVTSKTNGDEISNFLEERGSGVFAIQFEVINIDSTYAFLSERLPTEALLMDSLSGRVTVLRKYAHGVQLDFVNEPASQALMAQRLQVGSKLDSVAAQNASGMYQKYCALCHGEDRQGYAADNAPSLRSKSLLGTSKSNNFMRYTMQYGRVGTAMAGYLDAQGGPMEYIEIEVLLQWLYDQAGVEKPIELSREPVLGDIALGTKVYQENCAVCHGTEGEGISAPALGGSMLLATATDEFLKYAISEGRDGTPMIGFKDILDEEEINGVTAFLRSRAAGWNIPEADTVTIPTPDNYVLNPTGKAPNFELRDGRFVSAAQVNQALQDHARMIILDARSEVAWRQTHIPGSIPVPYYEDPETFVNDIPNDSTWIVAYCACPHAASGRVVQTLKRYGYQHTAILDEGILVWAGLGYPVKNGQ
ncbi:MAG: c-type cytochrome [Cyclobacteriaceae bacterium]